MEHSPLYEKIKNYYENGFWPIDWVRNAVLKKKITAEEFTMITGSIMEGDK